MSTVAEGVHEAGPAGSTPANAAPVSATAAAPSAAHIQIRVAELVDGHQLTFPIQDGGGLLLLAEGSLITARFKELLLARGVNDVMVHEFDATRMAAGSAKADGQEIDRFDTELTRKLDELVDSGRLFAADAGPQFKERLVLHGCKGYNGEQRERLLKEHAETCATLDDMIKSAAHGKSLNSGDVATVVSNYLTHLTFDTDCVLEVVNGARRYATIAEHCLNVSLLGMALAIELGMDESTVRMTGLCGLLHDWGMTRVPAALREAGRVLRQAEFVEIQKHPIYTLEMLQRIPGLPSLVPLICYQVHEQPNGQGYPRGRKHKNIHPCAGILRVADAFVALTSPRPFRLALTPYSALECLLRNARERLVDPDVVRGLLHVMSLFPIGSAVVLTDGSIARVLRRNGVNFRCPIVQLLRESDGQIVGKFLLIDTAEDKRQIVKAIPTPGRKEMALSPDLVTLKRV